MSGGPHPLRGLVDLLPPRGRQPRQGHARHHPRAPVQQARDVQLHRPGRRRGRARAPARVAGGHAAGRSASPTGSSTPRPATSARARPASTTSRRGCRRRAPTASSRRPRTARRSRRAASTSATAPRAARRTRSRPSTAPSRPPAGSSRSSRRTSRPTVGRRARGAARLPRRPRACRAGGAMSCRAVERDARIEMRTLVRLLATTPWFVALDIDGTIMHPDETHRRRRSPTRSPRPSSEGMS